MTSSSYNQTSLSSASTSLPTRWDVFISFRGVDTRYTFTDHLYNALHRNGIQTFMDDPELRAGEVIADALIQAIRESKIYVVVFSENYASSKWCLDELVEINSMGRMVIPVFYNIEPSVVRHQIGSFKQAFQIHETRFDADILVTWRITLSNSADLSGYHVGKNMSEAGIINEIVDEIFIQINPRALDVAKYPVGLVARVKSITTLLSSDAKCVIRIGIYGMGGVGKTTLAKSLYNQLLRGGSFKGSSFVANVREVSEATKGLVSLQQQIIDDILKSKKQVEVHNVEEGTGFIRDRICSTKVLLLIDDIYDLKQYESLVGPFAAGSVVIITTRDEEVLDKIDVEPRYRYRVNELDDAESLALFNQHAFGNAEPNETLKALTEDILRFAGGLPMALEVFGSTLSTRSVEGWTAFIETMQRKPNRTIQDKLISSLDALESDDPMLKKIFIDIACFFIGREKAGVVKIMETYYSYVNHNIDILHKRCLLTINDKYELRMHDLLRDMGRGIARNNSHDEPGKHSRLWVSKDICDVLKNKEGTEAIECIIYRSGEYALDGGAFTTESFKRMSKLRFLNLEEVNLTGSFEQIFKDLRWLRWNFCPLKCLPSEFFPEKLVILELPHSNITMWKVSHVFGNLKIVDMSDSENLTRTPDFKKLPCLETLNLGYCKSLEEVHMSIGSLVRLVSLNLCACLKLGSLPDTICNLRALQVLTISQCTSLKALPSQLGNIKSLTKLNAGSLTVSRLPDSIGHLTELVELDLSNNKKLKTLPDTICNLRSLEIFNINSCSGLKALPMEIGNIESLKRIDVWGLTVSQFPDSIGSLTKLVRLDLSYNTELESLPDTISNLRSLEILSIKKCKKLERLPDQLWKIPRLRELNAKGTTLIKKLPDIGSSEMALSLRELKLSFSGVTALPFGFSQLSNLQSLDLENCHNLLCIPEFPPNLKHIIAFECKSLERLPNLSNLKHLETLDLTLCGGLIEILRLELGLTEIQDLEKFDVLGELNSTCCSGLTYMQGLKELTSIRRLGLGGCRTSILTKRLFQMYSEFEHQITISVYTPEIVDWRSHPRWPDWTDWITESPYWITESSKSELTTPDAQLLPNESRNLRLGYSVNKTTRGCIWSDSLDVPLSTVYAHLLPNESRKFKGLILCFKRGSYPHGLKFDCSVKNTTSGFTWSDCHDVPGMSETLLMVIVPKSIFSITDDDYIIEFAASNIIIVGIHLLYKTETKVIEIDDL